VAVGWGCACVTDLMSMDDAVLSLGWSGRRKRNTYSRFAPAGQIISTGTP
jgi:hypothetical protein